MRTRRTAEQFEVEPNCKCAMQPHLHQGDLEGDRPSRDNESFHTHKINAKCNYTNTNAVMKVAWMNKGALIASTYVRGSNGKEKRTWRGKKTDNRERD